MDNKDLERLENVVQKMLGNINDLKKENSDLQAQVSEKNSKIEELENTINSLSSDQTAVSSRVSSLISSIEEWEQNLDTSTTVEENLDELDPSEPVAEETADKKEAQLFDLEE